MDTTKEYIKMCEKAVEIQSNWELNEGDFYYSQYGCFVSVIDKDYGDIDKRELEDRNRDEYIWLLRQDQLQEMVHYRENQDWDEVFANFCNYMDSIYDDEIDMYGVDSLEQAWLMFVMKENYRKTWNGEDWIDG